MFSLTLFLLPIVVRGLGFTHAQRSSDSPDSEPPKAKIATGWYAGWHTDPPFVPSNVNWDKYTELTYAFATTTRDGKVLVNEEDLNTFVAAAHAKKVKAKVSVGGWTGSQYWSSNVATQDSRTAFVTTLVEFAKKYDLQGLDFDWEYPAGNSTNPTKGMKCNLSNRDDTANFLVFIQDLRKAVGNNFTLSAATAISPFIDSDGKPSANVSAFAEVLDYIAIMAYDIGGPWNTDAMVGPNAPLDDSCAPPASQTGSAVSAVEAWKNANFPLEKLVLGVASYGHSFSVSKDNAFKAGSNLKQLAPTPFNNNRHPAGDSWDGAGVDPCTNLTQPQSGVINFWGLIQQGYLDKTGQPKAEIPYLFDECSQTPYVYNTTTGVMISFDDARSFAAKGDYIKSKGLGGFAMWEAGGDQGDILIDSIREAAGF